MQIWAWIVYSSALELTLWLAGNEGIEKWIKTTILSYIGTTIRIPKPEAHNGTKDPVLHS